jgi:hypothetical protein
MEPIRIFIGCPANGEDAEAQALLEYTLRKHHPENDLELNWMMLSHDPASPWYSGKKGGWNTQDWATPFSVFRWALPHVCNYEGRAIYMDVDQIVMADIGQLWNQSIPSGKALLWKNEKHSCVMLMDCAAMKGVLPPFEHMRRKHGGYSVYRDNHARPRAAQFTNNWNCLDGEAYATLTDPDIKIIHFTKVETQPHLRWALPRLAAKGQKHWNQWTLRAQQPQPHRRADVQPLVDTLWQNAQDAGYTAAKYEAMASNFGTYNAVREGPRAA